VTSAFARCVLGISAARDGVDRRATMQTIATVTVR
jgi:hypothetical protein